MSSRYALLVVASLAACDRSPDPVPPAAERVRYLDALAMLPERPEAAIAACAGLGDALRGPCVVAAVEAAPRHAEAAAWCDALPAGTWRDECRFQRAERTGDLAGCAEAGAFADDCRLHVWSQGLHRLWPRGTPVPDGVAAARAALGAAGIDPADDRFWSATFRHVLLASRPFDRRVCDATGDERLADVCRRTGVAVYHDLLNHERDFGAFPCDGAPLPERLAYAPDPEIDEVIARRRAADLCAGLTGGRPDATVPR